MSATAISLLTASREGPDTIGFRSSGPSPTAATPTPSVHLVGPGRVGRSFLRLLAGTGYRLIGVSDTRATVFDRRGLDACALADWKARGRGLDELPDAEPVSAGCAVGLLGADLVVDATATDEASTGESVARGRAALRAGSRLALAAKNGLRLAAGEWLLGQGRGRIGCNAVLGGTGLQLLRELEELRAGCEEVALVPNVSSTAILAEVERGASLDDGLKRARQRGFLEADPTRDLDGSDAAEKLCIVATALWGTEDHEPFAIGSVERQDLRDLARIPHQPPAAAPYLPASAASCSVGLLDRMLQPASGGLGRTPCSHRHLRHLATEPGEKCGLDVSAVRAAFARGATTRLVARGRRGGPLRVALEEVPSGSPLAAPPDRVVYAYRLGDRLRLHVGCGVGHERTAHALLQDVAALEVVR